MQKYTSQALGLLFLIVFAVNNIVAGGQQSKIIENRHAPKKSSCLPDDENHVEQQPKKEVTPYRSLDEVPDELYGNENVHARLPYVEKCNCYQLEIYPAQLVLCEPHIQALRKIEAENKKGK